MANKPNTLLRVLVPLVMMLVIAGVGYAVFTNSGKQARKQSDSSTPPASLAATPAAPAMAAEAQATPATSAAPPAAAAGGTPTTTGERAAITQGGAPLTGLRARVYAPIENGSDGDGRFAPLGSLVGEKAGDERRMLIEFSTVGAGVSSLKLADHFTAIGKNAEHETLQRAELQTVSMSDGSTLERTLVPLALMAVEIEGQLVNLVADPSGGGTLWRQTAPGAFEAEIRDERGATIGVITRRYLLDRARYDFTLEQRFENRTDRPLSVRWHQLGPVDLPVGVIRYGGDVRRLRLGYLTGPAVDPEQQVVRGDTRFLVAHATVLGAPVFDPGRNEWVFPPHTIWPDAESGKESLSLSWAALTNRYFAVAVHAIPSRQAARSDTPTKVAADKRFHAGQQMDRVVLVRGAATGDKAQIVKESVMALKLASESASVAPGATLEHSLGVYAGPLSGRYLAADETQRAMGLAELVVFTFGGPCGFCTFQPIAQLLRAYLGVLHDYVVFDWALAIVVLVLTVRTILHPVTRWSQTSLARFSKQMAALAPKQAKIREKYAGDPQKMREELARLMKEENVNYAGALGCLPMFLQTPVWIALYAMIFFTFELRHEAGLFGVFQKIGHPTFLADLSDPDHFLSFGTSINIPLLSGLMGPIDGFNLVPLILGVVFFIQQKYLTPPPTATLTPEQESQQRIMKVVTVVMFPLMMYNAPAALSLYFMTNSSLGILESRWIRKGIERAEEQAKAAGEAKGTPGFPAARRVGGSRSPAPAGCQPGWLERFRLALEEKQRQIEKQRREDAKKRGK